MDLIGFVFTEIDILYHPLQNYKKFDNVKYEKNVYKKDGEDAISFDVCYDPTKMEESPLPILINIHGGGFVKGDKKHRVSLSSWFADKGYFVLNVNYRLAPEYPYPTALQDIFEEISAFETIAQNYNVDLESVVFSGDSAGAYYATMAYAAKKDQSLYEALHLPSTTIKASGLISFSGLYDCKKAFSAKYPFGVAATLASEFLGTKINKDLSNLEETPYGKYLSPIDFINESWDKVFISYAQRDLFLKGQGEELLEKLREKGVMYDEDGAKELTSNHCYNLLFYKKSAKRCMDAVARYLAEIKK